MNGDTSDSDDDDKRNENINPKQNSVDASLAFGGARPKVPMKSRIVHTKDHSPRQTTHEDRLKKNSNDVKYGNFLSDSTWPDNAKPLRRMLPDGYYRPSFDETDGDSHNSSFLFDDRNAKRALPVENNYLFNGTLDAAVVGGDNVKMPFVSGNARLLRQPTPSSSAKTNREERSSVNGVGDLEPTDTTDEDSYIYTYKGGTAYLSADLPTSFFRLDSGSDAESMPGVSGAGQSNLSTGVAALIQDQLVSAHVRPDSPEEQDFLELDFDPGSDDSCSSDDSGHVHDSHLSDSAPVEIHLPHNSMAEGADSSPASIGRQKTGAMPDASSTANDSPGSEMLNRNVDIHSDQVARHSPSEFGASAPSSSSSQQMPEPITVRNYVIRDVNVHNNNNDEGCKTRTSPSSTCCPPSTLWSDGRVQASQPVSEPSCVVDPKPLDFRSVPLTSPVEDVSVKYMPRSKSLNSSLCARKNIENARDDYNLLNCGTNLMIKETLLFSGVIDAVKQLSVSLNALPGENCQQTPRAMIWTEKEAYRKHISQIGASACGATAVINVLSAFNEDLLPEVAIRAVKTRLRREDSDLPDYLLSRSEAGCRHVELLEGVRQVSGGRIDGRFFPMFQRNCALSNWLASWISMGCVPVATLNVQRAEVRPGEPIADAWHHQMIWGVNGKDVYLTNPLEVLSESTLAPQLDSPSELLIKREDVVSRFNTATDLSILKSTANSPHSVTPFSTAWKEYNVLGQIINVLREERSAYLQDSSVDGDSVCRTTHVRIPAVYKSGITLFCDTSNKDLLSMLHSSSDLPSNK